MRKTMIKLLAPLLCFCILLAPQVSAESKALIAGGIPFGVRLCCDGAAVVGISEIESGGKKCSPAKDAGLCVGDVIVAVDGVAVGSADEIVRALRKGDETRLSVRRDGKKLELTLCPLVCDSDGIARGGMWIRDSASGIGTVTYIDPESGEFAGLGHGICDPERGELLPMKRGIVVGVEITGVEKGSAGSPGELKGRFTDKRLGSLLSNTECGVYGIFAELGQPCISDTPIEVAEPGEIHDGEAEIISTVSGERGRYSVSLAETSGSDSKVKNFVVTVTDERLIDITGGIVQGMSGSPIIQDGKLVGAITHVLVNDPTRGYGIFIENMLAAG